MFSFFESSQLEPRMSATSNQKTLRYSLPFNPSEDQFFFVPLRTDKSNREEVFDSYFMTNSTTIHKQIENKGLLEKLRRLASRSKYDAKPLAQFPFTLLPACLAELLTIREKNYWNKIKSSYMGKWMSKQDEVFPFYFALEKHNRLYETFRIHFFHPSFTRKESEKKLNYFMRLMVKLVELNSFSVFFTCATLLFDQYMADQIPFRHQRDRDFFFLLIAIYNTIDCVVFDSKLQRDQHLQYHREDNLTSFPFENIFLGLKKFEMKVKQKVFLQFISFFELVI